MTVPRDLFCGQKGRKGIDTNTPVQDGQAKSLHAAGYSFVLRYLPRVKQASHDVTAQEVDLLLSNGLAVMPVQHVEAGEWIPSEQKGTAYGKQAGISAQLAGFVPGTSVWLDLESVSKSVPSAIVITYCNKWFDEVAKAGFLPGIYVGWQPGINAKDLYYRLKFTRYWAAFNLNVDQYPVIAGACMQQSPEKKQFGLRFDPDTILGDKLNRFPMLTAPTNWNL
jgi:hypothetical protein